MGFNLRKTEDERRHAAEKEAAHRATNAQVLEDAERLIAAWNERQAKRRRSAPPSQLAIGIYGCAARPAAPLRQSTCAQIDTATLW